jgi:hypothetical protein
MGDVVEGETDSGVAHADMLVDFVKEHRNQSRLPIVAMDDVRMLVGLEHEFHCCAAEESESVDVVMMAVKNAAIEKVVVGLWVDEETFQPFHEAEINVAVNPLVVIRDPKIAVGFGQTPDAVVTHAIIFGEDDFDGVATYAELARQALDDIPEPADFSSRRAFGCDHHDEHGWEES